MILFRNAEIFSPERLGRRDVLVAGNSVVAMEKRLEPSTGLPMEVVEAKGLRMIPGLIDCHVHIAGGGGEGGPATRTPELRLSQLLEGAITSVIGCLGTDGFTRTVESVLMKAKALRQEGVSAWILTGSYQLPTPTILGDVGRDMALIEEVIGVGEVAIADHRSSCPTASELIRLAEHARVGGMLGNKAGKINLHMGDARHPFALIHQAVRHSELKLTQFLPTHCNRNFHIFEEAKKYGIRGYLDLTTSSYPFFPDEEVKSSRGLAGLLKAGVPLNHITFSSDGCGSLPQFDAQGNLVKLVSGQPRSLFSEVIDAVIQEKLPLETALPVATANVADIWKLPNKGRIGVGLDADLALLDSRFRLVHLLANGRFMIRDGEVVSPGTWEK